MLVYKGLFSARIQACRILLKFTNIAKIVHFSLSHNNNDPSYWVTAGSLCKCTLFRTLPFPQYWASLYHSDPPYIRQTPSTLPDSPPPGSRVCTVYGSLIVELIFFFLYYKPSVTSWLVRADISLLLSGRPWNRFPVRGGCRVEWSKAECVFISLFPMSPLRSYRQALCHLPTEREEKFF